MKGLRQEKKKLGSWEVEKMRKMRKIKN